MADPYSTPKADLKLDHGEVEHEYAGFWVRVGASIIDTILILLITSPLLYMLYGGEAFAGTQFTQGIGDILLSYVFPIVATILFWIYRSATPGKMLLNLKIIRSEDGSAPTKGQCVLRYVGYIVSSIALGLGLIWVAFDKRKQGWHDKMAKTYVVRDR